MVNLTKKWRSKPFVCGVPTPSVRHPAHREAKACCFCGSVTIIGGDVLDQSRKRERYFCDIECAGQYKKWHNKTSEYKVRWYSSERGLRAIANKEVEQLKQQMHAGWRCCLCCGKAYKSQAKLCECCAKEQCRRDKRLYAKTIYRKNSVKLKSKCVYCDKDFYFWRHKDKAKGQKFCSEKCTQKAGKERRKHWIRANGQSEYIPLKKLAMKYQKQCCGCNVKVTQYSGFYRSTDATLDHIVPLSKGGTHTWDNVQLLCHQCNSLKSDSLNGVQLLLKLEQ